MRRVLLVKLHVPSAAFELNLHGLTVMFVLVCAGAGGAAAAGAAAAESCSSGRQSKGQQECQQGKGQEGTQDSSSHGRLVVCFCEWCRCCCSCCSWFGARVLLAALWAAPACWLLLSGHRFSVCKACQLSLEVSKLLEWHNVCRCREQQAMRCT